MAKQVERVDEVKMPADNSSGDIIVVVCDDGTKYVFEYRTSLVAHNKLLFSHRYYPDKTGADVYSNTKHRLPRAVEEYVRNKYHSFSWRDEMLPGAILNKEVQASFNNGQLTKPTR